MNGTLKLESQEYPVENILVASGCARADVAEAGSLIFVSPIELPKGKRCFVVGGSVSYQIEVYGCCFFHFSRKFLISSSLV